LPGHGEIQKTISIHATSPLYSDPRRLSVILRNLISNSIKYRDVGKAKQTISVSVIISEEGTTILFEDNGIGIDAVLLPRVFDMFFVLTKKAMALALDCTS